MGPRPETCSALLRPLRTLLGIKHMATTRGHLLPDESLPDAAAGLLGELVHNGESRASDLAAHRFVDASVVSRQVSQLEHAGLISRRPDPVDRRVSLLRATPEGEQLLAEMERRKAEWLSNALDDWDERDVRALAEMLRNAATDVRRAAQDEAENCGHRTTGQGSTGQGSTGQGTTKGMR